MKHLPVILGGSILLLVVLIYGGYFLLTDSAPPQSPPTPERIVQADAVGVPVQARLVSASRLPDELNAWAIQRQATDLLDPKHHGPSASVQEFPAYPPFGQAWEKLAHESEQAHQQVFVLMRQARQRPQALFTAFDGFDTSVFKGIRQLADVLGDGILWMHVQGNDLEALERIADLLHLSDTLKSDPSMHGLFTAAGVDALACNRAQIIAPGLKLDGQHADKLRSAVRMLIARFLHEDRTHQVVTHILVDLYHAPEEMSLRRLQGLHETIRRTIAERRASAIALAIQLYRADHNRWPTDLSVLVPNDLPYLPLDPYHLDGRPIGYTLAQHPSIPDQPRPVLFFDPSAVVADVVPSDPTYGWQMDQRPVPQRETVIRQYRDVSRWHP